MMAVLVACSNEVPTGASVPSPLLVGDTDRLWMLLRASRVGDGRECQGHYLYLNDRRYQGLAQKCDFWTHNLADYLLLNGYSTIEYQHLQESEYWRWFVDKRNSIQECRNRLGVLPIPTPAQRSEEHYQLRNACDPYDDARNNHALTPTELGIKYR